MVRYRWESAYSSTLGGSVTVESGAALNVGADASVTVSSEQTFSDAGTMTFSSGDQVTLYGTDLSVSGNLTANSTNFVADSANITFGSTATLSGGTNTFNTPIYVPYTLVSSLVGNTSFDQIEIVEGTISSGTLSLNLIGNNSNMSYVFPDAFAVDAGGTMAVGANVQVLLNSELTFSDAGTMTFSSGDQVTLYGTDLSVSGTLTANSTTFVADSANITFASTAILSGGTNTFNMPIYVPYTLVPSLAGNTSFDQIEIVAGSISSGTLSLNLIGNNSNMSYVFPDAFAVDAGGTMAVGANVQVLLNSELTFSDAGTMTFSSGDQVTLYGTDLSVSGSLTANSTTFVADSANITFASTATLSGGTNTFNTADLRPLHSGPLARGQYQLRSDRDRSGRYLQRNPVAQPDRQQLEHELCVPRRLRRGRWWNDGGGCQRAGAAEFGADVQRRGNHDLLQR